MWFWCLFLLFVALFAFAVVSVRASGSLASPGSCRGRPRGSGSSGTRLFLTRTLRESLDRSLARSLRSFLRARSTFQIYCGDDAADLFSACCRRRRRRHQRERERGKKKEQRERERDSNVGVRACSLLSLSPHICELNFSFYYALATSAFSLSLFSFAASIARSGHVPW